MCCRLRTFEKLHTSLIGVIILLGAAILHGGPGSTPVSATGIKHVTLGKNRDDPHPQTAHLKHSNHTYTQIMGKTNNK